MHLRSSPEEEKLLPPKLAWRVLQHRGREDLVLQPVSGPPLHSTRIAAIMDTGHLAATVTGEALQSGALHQQAQWPASAEPNPEWSWGSHSVQNLVVLRKKRERSEEKGEALSSMIRESAKHLNKHLASQRRPREAARCCDAGRLWR